MLFGIMLFHIKDNLWPKMGNPLVFLKTISSYQEYVYFIVITIFNFSKHNKCESFICNKNLLEIPFD